jgi:urease subunit gamma/beta
MRLTPTERDRLLLFSAAELARSRRERGLLLNVPEATALIADTAAEAARDGKRLLEAAAAGRNILSAGDVLPGVAAIVTEVKVEAVFEDGTRMIVIRDPFQLEDTSLEATPETTPGMTPGEVLTDAALITFPADLTLCVTNTSEVPISITSHFHFFEVNSRLSFPRAAAYGMRLAIPAGSSVRFDVGIPTDAPLVAIGGDRVAIGFAGLVDGPLDDDDVRRRALQRAFEGGFLGAEAVA